MRTYAVYRVDDEDARQERLGDVGVDEQGRLDLRRSEPGAEAELRDALEELNESEWLAIKTKPLPGAAKFSIRKERVERGDPRFIEALQDNLRRWHNMELAEE